MSDQQQISWSQRQSPRNPQSDFALRHHTAQAAYVEGIVPFVEDIISQTLQLRPNPDRVVWALFQPDEETQCFSILRGTVDSFPVVLGPVSSSTPIEDLNDLLHEMAKAELCPSLILLLMRRLGSLSAHFHVSPVSISNPASNFLPLRYGTFAESIAGNRGRIHCRREWRDPLLRHAQHALCPGFARR